jgi:hypothetical protein
MSSGKLLIFQKCNCKYVDMSSGKQLHNQTATAAVQDGWDTGRSYGSNGYPIDMAINCNEFISKTPAAEQPIPTCSAQKLWYLCAATFHVIWSTQATFLWGSTILSHGCGWSIAHFLLLESTTFWPKAWPTCEEFQVLRGAVPVINNQSYRAPDPNWGKITMLICIYIIYLQK